MESRIINTALCSFGMSGRVFHAPFLQVHPGFRLYGAWERTSKLAAEKYPGTITFRTLEDMLADDAIELVVINTPNYTHFDYAEQALLAGKHIIVEKPFTNTVQEADALVALAGKQQRKIAVYHNRRYDSDFRTIQKVLQEGVLGNMVEAEFHFDRYREALSPKLHKELPGPGAGALYDLGAHLIDQALQLFGMPQSLFADIASMRPLSQVDDYFEIILYYSSFRVRLKGSYQVREALPGYILHGSKGSFIKPKTDVQETMLQAGQIPGGADWGKEPDTEMGLLHTELNGTISRAYIPSLQGNYGDYYEAVYQAIINDAPMPVSAAEGRQVVHIIETAFRSSKERTVIDL
jgi:scyllo-inositol 2-dehydrogenase (NADP+)